jgi:opacity protein-like surface antigen
MKKALLAATAISALVGFSAAAQAADPVADPGHQWYITGFGGYSFAEDYDYEFTGAGGAGFDYTVSLEDGFVIGGAFGYIWNDNVRTELEVSYGNYDFDDDYVGTTAGFVGLGESGDIDLVTIFANVWLNADLEWVQPYIGGGLGVGIASGDLSITNGAGDQFSSTEVDLAVQGGAGFRIPVTESVEVDLSYRLRVVFDVDFDSDIAGFSGEGDNIVTHTAQGGITFKF